jgi:pilus assembly protein CpaF
MTGAWAPGALPGLAEGKVRLVDRALVERVRARLVADDAAPTPAAVARALLGEGRVLGDAGVRSIVDVLHAELVGLGPLQPFACDPAVTDILVVGHDRVWVDAGEGLQRVALTFSDDRAVVELAQRLAARCARRLDEAQPYADGQLPGGIRLHAVIPPVTERPCVSLRLARTNAFSLDDLRARGTVDDRTADVLRAMVEHRLAFLVSGGTGSGKTTLLSTLLGLVPPQDRIVVVEDTTELAPHHPHVVRMQARPANIEGSGEVSLRTLVRQALRMRPDRLVVGEVRGAEVADLLAALNTGHEGGCGTLHANASRDVPTRVEALGMTGGLDRLAVHSQLAAAIDVVMHLVRDARGTRRIGSIGVLERAGDGTVVVTEALRTVPDTTPDVRSSRGPGWPRLCDRLGAEP